MTEMKKHIYDESNGLWYERIGDYYIPALTLPSDEQRPIGKWGADAPGVPQRASPNPF